MGIGEETLGVRYNLLHVEAVGLILSSGCVHNTNLEGSLQAANGSTALIWTSGVWEGLNENVLVMVSIVEVCEEEKEVTYKSWWSSLALSSFVDMCRSKRRGRVLSGHAAESDVVADGVLSNVDAVFEEALGAGLTGCRGAGGGDDLVWGGLDDILGVEVEELLILLPGVVVRVPFRVPVFLAVGLVVTLTA